MDQSGVGQLMEIAVKKGKSKRRGIKLGICGEHGGDPDSVKFCHQIGLNSRELFAFSGTNRKACGCSGSGFLGYNLLEEFLKEARAHGVRASFFLRFSLWCLFFEGYVRGKGKAKISRTGLSHIGHPARGRKGRSRIPFEGTERIGRQPWDRGLLETVVRVRKTFPGHILGKGKLEEVVNQVRN